MISVEDRIRKLGICKQPGSGRGLLQPKNRKEWLSAKEIAAFRLPQVPATQQGVWALAQREGWDRTDKARPRAGRGGGTEYHISLLPESDQAAFMAMRTEAPAE